MRNNESAKGCILSTSHRGKREEKERKRCADISLLTFASFSLLFKTKLEYRFIFQIFFTELHNETLTLAKFLTERLKESGRYLRRSQTDRDAFHKKIMRFVLNRHPIPRLCKTIINLPRVKIKFRKGQHQQSTFLTDVARFSFSFSHFKILCVPTSLSSLFSTFQRRKKIVKFIKLEKQVMKN